MTKKPKSPNDDQMVYDDISDVNHDPELAKALGNVMVAWAFAETALVMALSRLTGVTVIRATRSYYRIPTFESRVKFIRALLEGWSHPAFDNASIDDAISRISSLSATRNKWVHGVWVKRKDSTATAIFNYRAPDDHHDRVKPVKAHDVNLHCETVRKHARELLMWVNWTALPT
jgi:hypothetical protein